MPDEITKPTEKIVELSTTNTTAQTYAPSYEYVLPWKDIGAIAETFSKNNELQKECDLAKAKIAKYESEVTAQNLKIAELEKLLNEEKNKIVTPSAPVVIAPAPVAPAAPVSAPAVSTPMVELQHIAAGITNYENKEDAESKSVKVMPKAVDHDNEGTMVLTTLLKKARDKRIL